MSWERSFLSWFAEQGHPMSERSLSLGGVPFFQFSSSFDGTQNKRMYSFGTSFNREDAALKCAAEAVERRFMDQFYESPENEVTASSIAINSPIEVVSTRLLAPLPPKGMKTSNGWAVHSAPDLARTKAALEALERHLLIKSFYRWGWQGFRLIREIPSDELHLFLMTSRLTSAGYTSGIVAAKSPLYQGLSFGYCVGTTEETHEPLFWQSALFEAAGKILTLQGKAMEVEGSANAWLQREAKFYLETPFNLALLREGATREVVAEESRNCFLKRFDLGESGQLSFPLAAAYCWGGTLIPLCNQSALSEAGHRYFNATLAANDLPETVPVRHPIL